jgi:hypothetical protein
VRILKILPAIIFLCCFFDIASAQQYDFYKSITDPFAICTIDSPSAPLHYSTGHGYPSVKDPSDSYFILAADSGSGIITHFWVTVPDAKDTAHLKLYIDDSLIRWANLYDFFRVNYGVLRLPFNTPTFVANLCDIQIPYQKNFKITMEGAPNDVWYAVAWRPISGVLLPSFDPLNMDSSYRRSLDFAESIYRTAGYDPWKEFSSVTKHVSYDLSSGSTRELFTLHAPGIISKLRFIPEVYNEILDSIFLDIVWDKAPFASVHVPLSDFFCIPPDTMHVSAFPIKASRDSGLISYFPMPFSVQAKISLINISSRNLNIASDCRYQAIPFDRKKIAYFHAEFNETNPTRYKVFHSILQSLGTGRLVGLSLSIPHNSTAASLEGDPFIYIDSNPANLIHYTGTEDYFDGGFYFGFHLFNEPFSGHLDLFKKFYRFHYLDAIDFKKSINFLFQHGSDNDVYEDYRSCAYYYKLWTPFWTSRDTIKSGESWRIRGTGYLPGSSIAAHFENKYLLFSLMSDSNGEFDTTIIVPSSWPHGLHKLSINNDEKPEPIIILDNPSIKIISDFLPPIVRFRDTLLISGVGYEPNEKISLYLDDVLVSDSSDAIITNSDNRFYGVAHIPNLVNKSYHLIAEGEHHNRAIADDLVTISRIIPYEFENMIADASWTGGSCRRHNLSANWYAKWSRQEVASFDPGDSGKTISFKFFIPVNDTFDVNLFLSKGSAFGNYIYSIDNIPYGLFNGSAKLDPPWFDPQPGDTLNIGTIYFAKDTHTITFHCTGKDSAATGFLLEADMMLLSPTTIMKSSVGMQHSLESSDIFIYPNPSATREIIIASGNSFFKKCDIFISDVLGRYLMSYNDVALDKSFHIDTHALSAGNYFVEFISKNSSLRESRMLKILGNSH